MQKVERSWGRERCCMLHAPMKRGDRVYPRQSY